MYKPEAYPTKSTRLKSRRYFSKAVRPALSIGAGYAASCLGTSSRWRCSPKRRACKIPFFAQGDDLPRQLLGFSLKQLLGHSAEYVDSVYTLRYSTMVADGIEFDWDAGNKKHLAAHKVTAREFEAVMQNSPLDLAYEVVEGEERYRAVGMTDSGRLLVAIWTIRDGKVRAVTAFPAGAAYRKLFPERKR